MIVRASLVGDSRKRRFKAAAYKAIAGVTTSRMSYETREIVAIVKTRSGESAWKKKTGMSDIPLGVVTRYRPLALYYPRRGINLRCRL